MHGLILAIGSVAALVQSSSPPVAGGIFACLQSAAMGGYGVAVVYGLVMASAAAWVGWHFDAKGTLRAGWFEWVKCQKKD